MPRIESFPPSRDEERQSSYFMRAAVDRRAHRLHVGRKHYVQI